MGRSQAARAKGRRSRYFSEFFTLPLKMAEAEWQHGLCGCCDHMDTCCFGYFCGLCLMMQNADNLGENMWLYCLMSCFTPCIPMLLLRGKARERYNIEGSTCEDVGTVLCCGHLANCQLAQEIQERGDKK